MSKHKQNQVITNFLGPGGFHSEINKIILNIDNKPNNNQAWAFFFFKQVYIEREKLDKMVILK